MASKAKTKKNRLPYSIQLNSCYHKHEFKTVFESSFKEKKEMKHDCGATFDTKPFSVSKLPNFVKDPNFLEGLKDELLDQIFYEKNNDLYKFQQTDDLKKISTPHVKAFRKFMYEDMRDWMMEITGIPLTTKVDLTCSRYDYTDTLLCHDDELDTRRLAFILYLVPTWKEEDGGSLDLFDMDDHLQPRNIVKRLVPEFNSFAWFEVTEASHHQVAEVLSEDKTRLSVNGWFHCPPIPRPDRYVEPPKPLKGYQDIDEDAFSDWINPIYLDPEVMGQIQEKFENESEIELQGFLREEKYHEVVKALTENCEWEHVGPANKRCYKRATEDKLPEVVKQCMAFLQSEAFFLTLSNLTGLSLHELAPNDSDDSEEGSDSEMAPKDCSESENSDVGDSPSDKCKPKKKRRKTNSGDEATGSDTQTTREKKVKEKKPKNPRCRGEIRKWSHGSYTLVHDTDAEGAEFALDAMLFCHCKGWQQEFGGFTSYIATCEDEELLTVVPSENSLALVYRDKDTLRFVKHINSKVNSLERDCEFYDFSLVYFE